MKIIKEFETEYVRISMIEVLMGGPYFLKEVGLTSGNEHELTRSFASRDEAEKEYKRLKEFLRDNGGVIMETIY